MMLDCCSQIKVINTYLQFADPFTSLTPDEHPIGPVIEDSPRKLKSPPPRDPAEMDLDSSMSSSNQVYHVIQVEARKTLFYIICFV